MNQTKINKILIVVVIFLFGSLFYTWFVIKEKSGIPSTNIASAPEISYAPNEWKTWTDNFYSKSTGESFSYKLQYPRDFDVLGGDTAYGGFIGGGFTGKDDVRLAFPEDAFQTPRTNYGGAYLVISIGTDKLSLDGCYKNPQTGEEFSDTQVINGKVFYTGAIRDLGAGSIYDSKIYRVLVDDRCFEVTQTIHTGNLSNYPAGTATEFDQSKAKSILNQMLGTFTIETVQPSISGVALSGKIATCYPKNENCSACQLILNNSVQQIVETSRRFVNVPKDFYPKEIGSYFTTVSGNATAGFIGSGGLPGEGVNTTPECWSTYFEFDGNGEVDLRVKSTKKGVPDYFVRFIVGPTQ